jgi:hypothetical protein
MTRLPASFRQRLAQEREQEAAQLDDYRQAIRAGNMIAEVAAQDGLSDAVPRLVYERWLKGEIPQERLAIVIWDAWVHNKAPERGLGQRAWLRLFEATGFLVASETGRNPKGRRGVNHFPHVETKPKAPLPLWRGASLTRARGMSWSVHRDCAATFAHGAAEFGVEAGIFRAVVPPVAMLASLGDEREQEIVVNPNRLRGRIVLDEAIPAVPLRILPGWPAAH